MRAGGGKQKGAQFERKVCKDLSLWISGGTRDDLLWRSAMSGGRATVGRRSGKASARRDHHAGDIVATGESNWLTDAFIVECKFYRDLTLGTLVHTPQRSRLWQFWEKLAQECIQSHALGTQHAFRQPLLIGKQNIAPTLLCTTQDGIDLLMAQHRQWSLKCTVVRIESEHVAPPMHVFNYDEVLKMRPRNLIETAQKHARRVPVVRR